MPSEYDECEACYGYAYWDPSQGVGIFPGLGCPGNCECPLFRKYVRGQPVTPSEEAKVQNEYASIGRRLEKLANARKTQP